MLRWGRWRVELWLVPRGAHIPGHKHPNLDAWLIHLWGRMLWRRGPKLRETGHLGPTGPMKVTAGQEHEALAYTRAAFLTIEHWLPGIQMTSAAHDLQLA